jgi:hypothetical protein
MLSRASVLYEHTYFHIDFRHFAERDFMKIVYDSITFSCTQNASSSVILCNNQYTKLSRLPTQPLHCSTIATGQASVSVNTCNPALVHKSRSAAVISLETRGHVRLQQLCNLGPDIWGNQVRMVPCVLLLYSIVSCSC